MSPKQVIPFHLHLNFSFIKIFNLNNSGWHCCAFTFCIYFLVLRCFTTLSTEKNLKNELSYYGSELKWMVNISESNNYIGFVCCIHTITEIKKRSAEVHKYFYYVFSHRNSRKICVSWWYRHSKSTTWKSIQLLWTTCNQSYVRWISWRLQTDILSCLLVCIHRMFHTWYASFVS